MIIIVNASALTERMAHKLECVSTSVKLKCKESKRSFVRFSKS